MRKLKVLQLAIVIVSITISAILFTSCQKEPTPVQSSNQPGLNKFSLPEGATFQSATFHIYVVAASNRDIDVHRITSAWEECSTSWTSFGGAYAPAIEGTFNASTDYAWASTDVTNLVGSWLDGTNPNYGLLLDQANLTTPRTLYASRRSAEYTAYLEICYTDAAGNAVCDTTRAIQDTYIYQADPGRISCEDFYMYTGWGWATDLEKQTLIQFDLAYTPPPPPQIDCETAYAKASNGICFLTLSPISANNWGWTNLITPGYSNLSNPWPIYAGAGQCDISKGTLVGHLNVTYLSGTITIEYVIDAGFTLDETHVWVGTNKLPMKNGIYQTAPGKFNYNGVNPVVITGQTGNKYVAAHSGVCWEVQ